MNERQEIHCHNCGKYVQFNIDTSLNGNHVLLCPECGHEHCRVVKDGIITDGRWDQRNGDAGTFMVSGSITITSSSTYDSYINLGSSTANSVFYGSWMNTTTSS